MTKPTGGAVKWTRQNTLPMEGMLHCFIEGRERKGDKIICRVDGYPDESEAFEARVDLIAAAPETAAERDRLREACKWCEGELEYLLALKITPVRPSGIHALELVKAALAKAPPITCLQCGASVEHGYIWHKPNCSRLKREPESGAG